MSTRIEGTPYTVLSSPPPGILRLITVKQRKKNYVFHKNLRLLFLRLPDIHQSERLDLNVFSV